MPVKTAVRRRSLWRFRRDPLRRRADVLEGWFVLIACPVVAVAGPFAGVLSAEATAHRTAQRAAELRPVTAVLLEDVPEGSLGSGSIGGRVLTHVRWTAADGTRHAGEALVDDGRHRGATVEVWLDRQGRPATPPLTSVQAGVDAAFMGAASFFAVATAAAAGYYGAHVVPDRRRRRAWDAEWRGIGPRWGRAAN
ncbi:hypothetical protein AB0G32_35365 [Streptomyces sp. NPDC023723]|uniref:Rv1733c family protein n=1 Tax=Streptomyces sp. NPDC023723 TaxID=3154323 RepID=UPI0033F71338